MARLFVYGELQKRSSLLELIGRVPPIRPALLRGFKKKLDEDTGYYVAVRDPQGVVEGSLLDGLRREELRALDEYEGLSDGLYVRDMVEVEVEGKTSKAYLYRR